MVLVVTGCSPFGGPGPAAVPRPHLPERSPQRHPQGAALHVAEQAPVTPDKSTHKRTASSSVSPHKQQPTLNFYSRLYERRKHKELLHQMSYRCYFRSAAEDQRGGGHAGLSYVQTGGVSTCWFNHVLSQRCSSLRLSLCLFFEIVAFFFLNKKPLCDLHPSAFRWWTSGSFSACAAGAWQATSPAIKLPNCEDSFKVTPKTILPIRIQFNFNHISHYIWSNGHEENSWMCFCVNAFTVVNYLFSQILNNSKIRF